MTQYIDKSTLVAKIEELLSPIKYRIERDKNDPWDSDVKVLEFSKRLLSFLDILEVKEVDLEKEMDKEWNKCEPTDEGMGLEIASIEHEQFDNIAKHFFELGMQVSNKVQKGEEV